MTLSKEYARRSLFWIVLILGILCILINLTMLFGLKTAVAELAALITRYAKYPELSDLVKTICSMLDYVKYYFVPASAGIFTIFIFLLWFGLRYSFSKLKISAAPEEKGVESKRVEAEQKDLTQNQQRIFLHLLAALQKEGRLLDFLAEDLETYEDDQIGAAVRSIHDNCKKTLSKYLVTEPVLKEYEGEEMTISPGFDPSAVKLTGNVVGDPPFKGIVRHRGWKVSEFEMPILSGSRDSSLIAPAEVEIIQASG